MTTLGATSKCHGNLLRGLQSLHHKSPVMHNPQLHGSVDNHYMSVIEALPSPKLLQNKLPKEI
eukprot:1493208-Amphidinium_carterae.1